MFNLKCTKCIHAELCAQSRGGADLDIAAADCQHFKDASNLIELPKKFWHIFNVPGFYNIVEYTTTFVTYSCAGLASISGTTGKQEAVVPGKELGITLFFSEQAAKVGLEKLIEEYHNEGT